MRIVQMCQDFEQVRESSIKLRLGYASLEFLPDNPRQVTGIVMFEGYVFEVNANTTLHDIHNQMGLQFGAPRESNDNAKEPWIEEAVERIRATLVEINDQLTAQIAKNKSS